MKYLLFLIFSIPVVSPGILLILGSRKFNSKVNSKSGRLILWGSILITIHLISSTGTYIIAQLGDAHDLAYFSIINQGVEWVFKFSGIVLIALGLFSYRAVKEQQ